MTEKTIALIGNQNCGKTTLFNALTGANQYVGNWPGVTVDQVIGKISKRDWDVVDLPGLYSLSPYSAEEIVSRNFMLSNDYDVVLNVVDATHLERSLSLTLEILPMGRPMVVALNMCDLLKDKGIEIDAAKLSDELGVKVVPISASSGKGLNELLDAIDAAKASTKASSVYPQSVLGMLGDIGKLFGNETNSAEKVFIATSLLQQDKVYLEEYRGREKLLAEVARDRAAIEREFGTDAEAYFPQARYAFIDKIMPVVTRKTSSAKASISRKIDNVVTNKWLALPIFAAIIYVIYYLAVTTVGTAATDYANDVVFGQWCTDGANWLLDQAVAPDWLRSLLVDGIIGGVGAVLGFVPQMIVLFFLLSIVEQCGYMTRVAFVLDRIFRRFGLSGRSFIPILIATGCAVPALMSTKSIDNVNEQRITLITTSFLPCSAKLPIMTMIFMSFFPEQAWIAPAVYLLGIFSIAVTGIILKKSSAFQEDFSPFVMELPDYHMPRALNVFRTTYERCKAFIIKAGTIIFGTVVIIWFLSNFNFTPDGFQMVDVSKSMLASFGTVVAFIFAPLGFGLWQAAVAVITGLLAKENVVGTMAVLLGLGSDVAEDDQGLSAALQGVFPTSVAAFAFLAFNLWSTPCVAALGAMKRQFGSGKWFGFAVSYMLCYAYCLSLVIYQIGGLILGQVPFGPFTVVAFIVLAIFLYLLLRKDHGKGASLRIAAKNV
ncbi:MAG: ferrous iron transport protein B [Aeromonadales bacterium]|nr:ferrous iron transport protein B [Aeromonadales bacterium]